MESKQSKFFYQNTLLEQTIDMNGDGIKKKKKKTLYIKHSSKLLAISTKTDYGKLFKKPTM